MIRAATAADAPRILALYRAVASEPRGLIRLADEITADYAHAFMEKSATSGIQLVSEQDTEIAAEIHAHRPGPARFTHVLSELTIAVAPASQGRGLGRALFAALLNRVRTSMPEIERVELVARAGNARAIDLYRSLGFREEGRLTRRVRDPDRHIDDDVPMAWLRADGR
jgi:putative acetyltransferase